jgi:apolipoprotein N-acyltransferase
VSLLTTVIESNHARARRVGDVLAVAAGAITPFAFAPFHVFPLAFLAPALLFLTWYAASPGRAAWRGFLYGLGFFGVGVSWVYVSLHNFGNMPAPLAGFAVALFVATLSTYPAALGWLQARFQGLPRTVHFVLVLPALWVACEWIRGWFLSGFPWLNLGYSQTGTPLAGFAPWLGVYGVSFAVALSAGLLSAALYARRRAWQHLALGALVWLLGWGAAQPTWVIPAGAPLPVAAVQANVPLSIKWRPQYRDRIIDSYLRLSERAPHAKLIAWPEAAVPGFYSEVAPQLLPRLEALTRRQGADVVFGTIELDNERRDYYNSVYVVGKTPGSYRKQHLVPFGEFLPLPGVFETLLATLEIPMSDFRAGGRDQPLLAAAGHTLGVSICYEDAFGEEIIRALPQATLLVNVSEDAWFGNSLAPHQRLQMARVRALETGRPMLRATNTGPSALIDHRGRVIARSPQFQPAVLAGTIQPMSGTTPYARLGNAPLLLLLGVILLPLAFWRLCRRVAKSP